MWLEAYRPAAIHGDELNGVKVVQEVAARWGPDDLAGTLVCLHVVNVPAYLAQQRYIPIYDLDLNRAFPGKLRSNTAERMAHETGFGWFPEEITGRGRTPQPVDLHG